MYTPPLFREEDVGRARALMRRHPFAALVSTGPGGLVASHVPLLVRDEPAPLGGLVGHMARANPHWRELDGAGEILVVFTGAHAYVSPNFYVHPDDNVPTWSYIAVHAYGLARTFTDPDRLRALLGEQVREYEAALDPPWTLETAGAKVDRLLGGIVGFEIQIVRFDAKLKVGQNRAPDDRAAAASVLAERPDEGSRDIAAWMRELGLA
jgi:transcriptional regulator